ncbi:MAG: LytTR family transcriptional regulator DNA-binding domain-containing protein [Peptostreptococcaceae bacterium]
MIFIGTCITDSNKRDIVFKSIEHVKSETNMNCKHLIYSSYNELLSNYTHNLDVLILEIDMNNINYLNLLSSIHKIDKHVDIIIISKASMSANTIYSFKNLTYIFNIIKKDIVNVLKKSITKNCKINPDMLTFTKKNQLVKIDMNSIKYIETESQTRNIIIYYENKSYKLKCPISEIEKKLNNGLFFRCHKSYVININKIIKIDDRLAHLDDGNYIPIGRDKVKVLKSILNSNTKKLIFSNTSMKNTG